MGFFNELRKCKCAEDEIAVFAKYPGITNRSPDQIRQNWAARALAPEVRCPGIISEADAMRVAPYDLTYRVAPGVEDWGYAVVDPFTEPGCSYQGPCVERVRRDWYERPRHKSPCVPPLLSRIFRTNAEAAAELAGRQTHCTHAWDTLSHEELVCRKCGDLRVVPDL